MKLSLRTRGFVALSVVFLYFAGVGYVLDQQRQQLLELATELEQLNEKNAALGKAAHAINHSLLRTQEMLIEAAPGASAGDDVALDIELVQAGLQDIQQHFPEFRKEIALLGHVAVQLRRKPTRDGLATVKETARMLDDRLTAIDAELRTDRAELWQRYHGAYDRMTVIGVSLHLLGLITITALLTLFFNRMAWDMRKVKERAAAIIDGYRGPPIEVTRTDEVGDLMQAVNQMQHDLREREGRLEIAREKHFHREKMAALGSLASVVAHEINNPIAAIAGAAQAMAAGEVRPRDVGRGEVTDCARLILEQTQRISAISRQIGEFARPRAEVPELVDLNALVRRTCRFLRYDRRLRHVDMELALDDDVPAVFAVADHLTQVLINLLTNAADAIANAAGRPPTLRIASRRSDDRVVLTVADNGIGMDAATLQRAFEESFSTKSAEGGRGLGLFLCRSLVERGGGTISLASAPDAGTTATVCLPLPAEAR